MSLHFGPSYKCSLFRHFDKGLFAMRDISVNKLSLVARLDRQL